MDICPENIFLSPQVQWIRPYCVMQAAVAGLAHRFVFVFVCGTTTGSMEAGGAGVFARDGVGLDAISLLRARPGAVAIPDRAFGQLLGS
jgi:hypothetical protein